MLSLFRIILFAKAASLLKQGICFERDTIQLFYTTKNMSL
ncbi:hypothetical protein RV10_GL001903 [Enterococcus pallens]|nr:hypothetical protein RV10_GL001903 [Enterococcus pallens]